MEQMPAMGRDQVRLRSLVVKGLESGTIVAVAEGEVRPKKEGAS